VWAAVRTAAQVVARVGGDGEGEGGAGVGIFGEEVLGVDHAVRFPPLSRSFIDLRRERGALMRKRAFLCASSHPDPRLRSGSLRAPAPTGLACGAG
jgi:hypothetical protein